MAILIMTGSYGVIARIMTIYSFYSYSREAPFIALNVDIRNHHSLTDSMEQFVKGDLLEGANAYHCEKCNKKVNKLILNNAQKMLSTMKVQSVFFFIL